MKTPTSKNIEQYVESIDEYDAAIKAYYEHDSNEDEEGGKLLFAAAQFQLLKMRAAWEKLSGMRNENLKDSDEARELLNHYIEDPEQHIDDFICRLKGEPDSMLTLLSRLTDVEIEVTPKLLSEIAYRLREYGIDFFVMDMDMETMEQYIESTDNGVQIYTNIMLMRAIRHVMSPEESKNWNK